MIFVAFSSNFVTLSDFLCPLHYLHLLTTNFDLVACIHFLIRLCLLNGDRGMMLLYILGSFMHIAQSHMIFCIALKCGMLQCLHNVPHHVINKQMHNLFNIICTLYFIVYNLCYS